MHTFSMEKCHLAGQWGSKMSGWKWYASLALCMCLWNFKRFNDLLDVGISRKHYGDWYQGKKFSAGNLVQGGGRALHFRFFNCTNLLNTPFLFIATCWHEEVVSSSGVGQPDPWCTDHFVVAGWVQATPMLVLSLTNVSSLYTSTLVVDLHRMTQQFASIGISFKGTH